MDKFEEIRDKIIEQILQKHLETLDIEYTQREMAVLKFGAKQMVDFLRPLLDGWKETSKELPDDESTVQITFINSAGTHVGEALFQDFKFFYIAETDRGLFKDQYGLVTHWRELSKSIPGDYSQMEALLKEKI